MTTWHDLPPAEAILRFGDHLRHELEGVDRDPGSTGNDKAERGRHHRNAHLLELDGCTWRCLICRHQFDAAVDANLFACGDDCTGKHPGDDRTEAP